jgi:peroxiredoxin
LVPFEIRDESKFRQMNEEIRTDRRKIYQSIILVFLAVIGVGIIVLLQTQNSSIDTAGKPRFKKGVTAPNFKLPDLDGKMVSLAEYRGKVVFLNIWATWCAPCVTEMPSMEKLHQELKNEDFEILAVSIDESGAEAVRPFMEKYQLSFRALVDPEGNIKNMYRMTGVPETFIIDKDGKIAEEIIGPRDWAAPGAIRYFRDLIRK